MRGYGADGSVIKNISSAICLTRLHKAMDSFMLVKADQVPAATAPAKEAVYEEATKNLPIKDELHLKKLSDYKTLSKGLMDVALLTANCAQLRQVLEHCSQWKTLLVILLLLSLCLQLAAALLLFFERLSSRRKDFSSALKQSLAIGGLVCLVILTNVAISAFGGPADACDASRFNSTVENISG